MLKKIIYISLLLFILLDISYSFVQHYSAKLDGDISESIGPKHNLQELFNSPLGIDVIINSQPYPNPNRFFTQWTFKEFLIKTPLFLQRYTDPINSVYLSCAIGKTIIQISLILLLSIAISGSINIFKLKFVFAAVLIIPFFQTNGYRGYLGIIDPSITYTFSYAFPCALTILYFLPFILKSYHKKMIKFHGIILVLWIPFGLVVCLSGPLNAGIALVFSLTAFLWEIRSILSKSNKKGIAKRMATILKNIPSHYWFYLIPICLFSLYSLYLGQYNLNNNLYPSPLIDLYLKLPRGIYSQFNQRLGFPVLFLALIINLIIITKKCNSIEKKRIVNLYKGIGLFTILFILLLPLGGFRDYRPNVLRYDTIMPITLSLIFLFGLTTTLIVKNIEYKQKGWYLPFISFVLLIFTYADKPEFDKNSCERIALEKISKSTNSVVKLTGNCTVLSWKLIAKPENSERNTELLYVWNITDKKKLYYHDVKIE